MSRFITRVELHTATWQQDYAVLHQAMHNAGFLKMIQDDNTKIWYHLPMAEYFIETNATVDQVNTAAKQAADSTGRNSSILTALHAGLRWINLEPVKKVV
jgi:hypothetical protein